MEIALALIVIGLAAGAILAGQELIIVARLHQQVKQFGEYNGAINAFRLKYSAMPGDLSASSAARHGFTPRSGANGHGDGDGVVERCAPDNVNYGSNTIRYFGCENVLFWSDLSRSNFIKDSLTAATDSELLNVIDRDIFRYVPEARIASGVMIHLATEEAKGENWYVLRNFLMIGNGSFWENSQNDTSSFKGPIAYRLDMKIDDGKPDTGIMIAKAQALSAGYFFGAPTRGSIACIGSVASNSYNLTSAAIKPCHINIAIPGAAN